MDIVLDLDLDFFGWPPLHYQEGQGRPIESEFEYLADEAEVCNFLERQCHLSKNDKILGRQFVEHVDAFRIWRDWMQEGKLTSPFAVVHVDAHSDLGAGMGLTCMYIETELLALPLTQRSSPRFNSDDGVNSANYLVAAIANRWISRLTYVYPTDPAPDERSENPHLTEISKFLGGINGERDRDLPGDLPPWCFQNDDYKHIQLAHRRREDFLRDTGSYAHLEPPVPFQCKKGPEFDFSGFTHMVVAQSRDYIPESSDHLLSVICEYFVLG